MKLLSLERVVDIVAKGEHAQYEQFLLKLQQSFQKSSAIEVSERASMWKSGLNPELLYRSNYTKYIR